MILVHPNPAGVAPVLCERIAKRCKEDEVASIEERLEAIIERRKQVLIPPEATFSSAEAEEGAKVQSQEGSHETVAAHGGEGSSEPMPEGEAAAAALREDSDKKVEL
jgi:hypothetical protein